MKYRFAMGETKTPHFHDLGIFEPVTKPQNQPFLSLETPGPLKESRKSPKHFSNIMFYESRKLETPKCWHFRKDGHRKLMTIRLNKSSKWRIWDQYLSKTMNGMLVVFYQKTWNGILRIWDQWKSWQSMLGHLEKTGGIVMKHIFGGSKTIFNLDRFS